ncbi:hypothetical protein [Pseudozobellia sp. WGM2]|uniref:hypothetical protein n=1 Tax=Pseudozobellia sp. WGM2 TaxID=2787625 RepID=UPI001AE012CD|nr:hypothetical protein [Pseudozobellia sp. WGM2]
MVSASKGFLGIVLLSWVVYGCVDLKHVSEFSETSIEAISSYELLPNTFEQVCIQDCEQKHIRDYNVYKTACDCALNKKADSITGLMYTASLEYLTGLLEISNSDLTRYQTDNLTSTLSTGDFGPLQLKEEDVKAYSKVSKLILKVFTDGYRRKKLKEYITEGYEPLQVILHFLKRNINANLSGKLNVQKSSIQAFYFDFVRDKSLSDYERTKFAEDYFNRISEIEMNQKELQLFSEVIDDIAQGHKDLYSNLENLQDEKIKGKLARLRYRLKHAIALFSS